MKLPRVLPTIADPFFGIRHQGEAIRGQLRGSLGRARATAMHMGPRPGAPHFARASHELSSTAGGLKGLGPHHRGHR